jgi:probable F420-dependent oxidoreductase
MASEYAAMGIAFDPPATRIARLAEAIAVIDQCFAEGTVGFSGDFYRVRDFDATPAPVQRPRPPIAVGGGGRRVLELAARSADIVSVNLDMHSGRFGAEAIASSVEDAMAQKVSWIRAAAGSRADEPTIEIGAHFTAITDDADTALEAMLRMPAVAGRRHPHALVGSVEEICDLLEERRARYGVSYVTVQERVAAAFAPVVARLAGR